MGNNSPLKNLKIAAPCPADWNGMIGNDRIRFCGQCSLNVYNLSEMSRRDAEDLINRSEGRLCVRYYQRNDGTILTDNCPVGLRAIRKRAKRIASAVISGVLAFFAGIGLHFATLERRWVGVQGDVIATPLGEIGQVPPQPKVEFTPLTGAIAITKLPPVQGQPAIPHHDGRNKRR